MVGCGLGITLVPNAAAPSIQLPTVHRPSPAARPSSHAAVPPEPLVEDFCRLAFDGRQQADGPRQRITRDRPIRMGTACTYRPESTAARLARRCAALGYRRVRSRGDSRWNVAHWVPGSALTRGSSARACHAGPAPYRVYWHATPRQTSTGDPFRSTGKWSPSRSENEKTAPQRGFQSPLPDSNRRPLPYHGGPVCRPAASCRAKMPA
jgi:hypothetical protein